MKATAVTLLALATFASGEETRIPVPAGSDAFPTLGEVHCLEGRALFVEQWNELDLGDLPE